MPIETINHTPKLIEQKYEKGSDWVFFCPGCKCNHRFSVGEPGYYSANWTFNGDVKNPTFSPSLKMLHSGCHLFVKNGMIEFCSDSPHSLAGKTVPMEDI